MQNWAEVTLQSELHKFRKFAGQISEFGQVETLAEDILRFIPIKNKTQVNAGFMALVHGNETLGLPILNQTLQNLLSGQIQTNSEVYFALGNVPAALADKRFLEKDLNRCFNENSEESLENRRALVLEKYFLDKLDYLLDIHQTVQKSDTAFFIFQYSSLNCLSHLTLMNSTTPTILQFENIGDQKGLSSDEYVRMRKRFGSTLELAQIGLNQTYFDVGYKACEKLILNLAEVANYQNNNKPFSGELNFEIFEISNRLVASEDQSILHNHLKNFSFVEKDQPIGQSQIGVINSPSSGLLLFPKLDQLVNANQTLAFLCTQLQLNSASKLETIHLASHL